MASTDRPDEDLTVADMERWKEGAPHALFAELRSKCPVHWSPGIAGMPNEPGFWSITRAEEIEKVSRDWKTFSSHLDGAWDIAFGDIRLQYSFQELRRRSHRLRLDGLRDGARRRRQGPLRRRLEPDS
ncbi:hypothetical protein SRB17_18310 [Streptomyces sp. RB17]|nr:hypothetical protein [Streptomyces sp. RB17]